MLYAVMKGRWIILLLLMPMLACGSSPSEETTVGLRSPNPDSRRRALFAVNRRRDGRLVKEVSHILHNDPLIYLRKKAATTLGVLGDRKALAPLARALRNDTEPLVRQEAAYALAALGYSEAVSILRQVWRSESHPAVRHGIAVALQRLGTAIDD